MFWRFSTSAKPDPTPAVDDIDRIAASGDPVIRNLQITQCYHEVSSAMRAFTGDGANWCTFATWASKQAGQTIREEDLARALDGLVDRSPEIQTFLDVIVGHATAIEKRHGSSLRETLRRSVDPEAAFRRAADAVARGNKKVFEEIGREFARFLATFAEDDALDHEKTARFCAGLRPGDPPDGQGLLRDAFAAYRAARFQDDEKERAELLLVANLLIGLHEQTRLQPEIAEALNSSVGVLDELRQRLLAAVLPGRGDHAELHEQ